MGVDPNLSQNLETFFTMQYPTFELLFCIEDKEDPAVTVVQNLMDKYPKIDAQLYLGGSDVGVNPKINNMNAAYENSKFEYVMISDSGIKMKEDTLLDMVQHMKEGIGLVHQMPFTCDREGFAATFEKIYFGTYQSRMYLTADLFGAICHTGMSSLIRREVLETVGGLKEFGRYLAEDFFIAKAIMDAGWKSTISSQPAWQNSGVCDVTNFQLRLTRWAKLRVAMVPHLIILEPLRFVLHITMNSYYNYNRCCIIYFSECMVLGCLASWAVNVLFQWDALPFYLVHILVWFLSDWIMLSVVQVSSTNIIHLSVKQSNFDFTCRMDRCRLTSLILLLAGCFESSADLICFSVHYSTQRLDGASGRLSSHGVASHMSLSRESNHSSEESSGWEVI